ncbi:MAG: MBOAT family protein [Lachnospiraceae bacterium]|nr:MBOAT family protein [Lachnospiraceae bacterium]
MLFSSITFLYFFLPTVFILYGIASIKQDITWRNLVLCVMSCLFYAWGEPMYFFLMLVQVMIVYGLTCYMEKKRESATGKVCFTLSVLLPFASLFYFKYTAFFMTTLTSWLPWPESWIKSAKTITLPIGISFYTFQLTSYCIDVWLGRVKLQKNLLSLMTYVALFPQLIAGPIVRYSDVDKELSDRKTTREDLAEGIVRFTIGLGKKVLIANVLGEFVAETLALENRGIALSWAYALAVSLQIYFDFSGYSDMAIGLGRMFGFHFPENFHYPFISDSLTEFWRRWHMTLGTWFRDYVYIPMGGNRVKKAKWFFNLLTVWFLTGLWHGAGWNFIIWGLFFSVFLILEKVFFGKTERKSSLLGKIAGHVYVVIAIIISFLIFHAENMEVAMRDIRALLPGMEMEKVQLETALFTLRNRLGILFIALVGSTPFPLLVWKRFFTWLRKDVVEEIVKAIGVVVILLLSTAYLIDGSFNPFLYFRF